MKISRQFDREVRVRALSASVFNLSVYDSGQPSGSGLDRYGFLKTDWPECGAKTKTTGAGIDVVTAKAELAIEGDATFALAFRESGGRLLSRGQVTLGAQDGYDLILDLADGERIYGLGDQNRKQIEHRGVFAHMWIKNVTAYIPVPFIMSNRGFGMFVNTTYGHTWDIDRGEKGKIKVHLPGGNCDLYFFYGPSLKEILDGYTQLTGRPCLPPKWSFGLWYECHTHANDFEVVNTALQFRDRKIPCDVIGLEPGWMSKEYDFSVEKKWHPERFKHYWGGATFIAALKRLGFKFELWLCIDYDLAYEEERRMGRTIANRKTQHEFLPDDVVKDEHFTAPSNFDKLTKPEEPWFRHLEKFVDEGADFFKMDAANQLREHPDRRWANGMSDAEMHNLYCMFTIRQMYEGFKKHTGRRPVGFNPNGWAGVQHYTGTWAGDTGGGPGTVVANLNLAMCGQHLTTCDIDVDSKSALHYGFLQPWTQINSFAYFKQPWLQGATMTDILREYAQLRMRLIPYLYSYCHQAYRTGMPIMRPLVLEYPNDLNVANLLTEYMLGRELLVSVYTDEVYLPDGNWLDFWTGEAHAGPKHFKYTPPLNRGGGVFVRSNSILPLGPVLDYVGQPTSSGLLLKIFLEAGKSAEFNLYDDDGVSFEYEKGQFKIETFKASLERNIVRVEFPRDRQVDLLQIHVSRKPDELQINEKKTLFKWQAKAKIIEIELHSVSFRA